MDLGDSVFGLLAPAIFCSHGRAIQHVGPLELGLDPLGLIGRMSILPRALNSDHLEVWPNHRQKDLAVPQIGRGPNIWPECQVWQQGGHKGPRANMTNNINIRSFVGGVGPTKPIRVFPNRHISCRMAHQPMAGDLLRR